MSGDPSGNALEAFFKAAIEVFLSRSASRGQHVKMRRNFLKARIEEFSKINRDWADERFLLDTMEVFVPLRLVSSTGRSEDLAAVISSQNRIVCSAPRNLDR